MELYQSGTDVTLTTLLNDRYGNPLDIASISYTVEDMTGATVVPLTTNASFEPSSTSVDTLIPAAVNMTATLPTDDQFTSSMIDAYNTRESRTLILNCKLTQGGNSIVIKQSYGIEQPDPLWVGVNSFLTMPNAELLAMEIAGLTGWSAASDSDKIAALITARSRICQLNFWLLNSNTNWGQDNLNFVPEGSYTSDYTTAGAGIFIFNGNLALLTPKQYSNLPVRFKTALKLAQVAEADDLLGGNAMVNSRRDGLLLESIGESKQMFRAGKPLDLPVSKNTLRYLSAYVTFTKHMGRG